MQAFCETSLFLPPRRPALRDLRDHRAERHLALAGVRAQQLGGLGGHLVSGELHRAVLSPLVGPDFTDLPRGEHLPMVRLAKAPGIDNPATARNRATARLSRSLLVRHSSLLLRHRSSPLKGAFRARSAVIWGRARGGSIRLEIISARSVTPRFAWGWPTNICAPIGAYRLDRPVQVDARGR